MLVVSQTLRHKKDYAVSAAAGLPKSITPLLCFECWHSSRTKTPATEL